MSGNVIRAMQQWLEARHRVDLVLPTKTSCWRFITISHEVGHSKMTKWNFSTKTIFWKTLQQINGVSKQRTSLDDADSRYVSSGIGLLSNKETQTLYSTSNSVTLSES